jgi:hypothetical protein
MGGDYSDDESDDGKKVDDDEAPKQKISLLETIFPSILATRNLEKMMDVVFADTEGKLVGILDEMQILNNKKEKIKWLKMWLEIDEDGNNKMEYEEYLEFFNIKSNEWVKRAFDVMNSSLTGVVSFVEFVDFCNKYLCVDKVKTIELSFQMMSRR